MRTKIDDLWFSSRQVGLDGKPVKLKGHGKGRRYRLRFTDVNGRPASRLFELRREAEAFERKVLTGEAVETQVDLHQSGLTFAQYADQWWANGRGARSLDYDRHTESRLRNQLLPYLGARPIRSIVVSTIRAWVQNRIDSGEVAYSSLSTYWDLLSNILGTAEADRVIPENPCRRLTKKAALHNLEKADFWVPDPDQINALFAVVPEPFQAAIWLGVGQGLRLGEMLAVEKSLRSVDWFKDEMNVRQQLRFHKPAHGGFYLKAPKNNSVGSFDLDERVKVALSEHIRLFPPAIVSLPDLTIPRRRPNQPAQSRDVALLFHNDGVPWHNQRWSTMFERWRVAAGWPGDASFHSLRHAFATMLINAGYEPQDVARALRHKNPRLTWDTYIHYWKRGQRRRNVISATLTGARQQPLFAVQDQS